MEAVAEEHNNLLKAEAGEVLPHQRREQVTASDHNQVAEHSTWHTAACTPGTRHTQHKGLLRGFARSMQPMPPVWHSHHRLGRSRPRLELQRPVT